MQQTAGDRKITYRIEDIILTSREVAALGLVINELVSNAIKHSQGAVDVTLEEQAGALLLEVCDDGPGFPPGFDPARASHTGLELVATLCQWNLGGQVSYTNRPEGGARVQVRLPSARTPALPLVMP